MTGPALATAAAAISPCSLGTACFIENCIGEPRPRLECPGAEVEVGQATAGKPGLGIDPEEGPRAAEVAERPRRVAPACPVWLFRILELEAVAPVVRLEASQTREDAAEPRK